jgi:hypothetical protein
MARNPGKKRVTFNAHLSNAREAAAAGKFN